MARRVGQPGKGWTIGLCLLAAAAVGGGLYELLKKPSTTPSGSASNLSVASVSGVPVNATYGTPFSATVVVGNSGQSSGNFSLISLLVLSGAGVNGTVQGHMGMASSPTSPVTGSVAGNSTTSATLTSGSPSYGNGPSSPAGYNASLGLDAWFLLTDTDTGTAVQYLVPSAVLLPLESAASLSIQSVAFSAT